MSILSQEFYLRIDVVQKISKELLGKYLVTNINNQGEFHLFVIHIDKPTK